jgi:uncharacterized protein YodC (DUF2158 family)
LSEIVNLGKKREAKSSTFEDGAVVYLKSGGPALTVRSTQAVNKSLTKVDVDWFVENERCTADFFAHQLTDRKPEVVEDES